MNLSQTIVGKPPTVKLNIHPSDSLSTLSQDDQALFKQYGFGSKKKPIFNLIHHAFEYQACQNPHNIAVIDANNQKTTYSELNRQANQLAAILQKQNILPGDGVCLFLRRSTEMVIGILACLKLGAYYIPQDIQVCPNKQRKTIAEISKSKVILTTNQYVNDIEISDDKQLIIIDQALLKNGNIELFRPSYENLNPENIAVAIFTSGTTGTPNGVRVTHANLCNILLTSPGNMGIKPGVKVAQILNIAFDMAVWEILGCLGNGGTLMIRGKNYQEIAQQVDILIATPSILLRIEANKCHHIKAVAVAGEPCSKPLAEQWAGFCDFYNSCGPTETTIINTATKYIPGEAIVSIGAPTPNNNVYILDENLKPCPIGEVGEMWAGGDCVTAGYLNNKDLTDLRYIDDPFVGNGQKMFRTKDLGRWTEQGLLEHLGRVDDQVKVKGFRVELDSVSAILETSENCVRAATLKLNASSLVAFVSPLNVDIAEAKAKVRAALPYYCEPLFIIPLENLPKTIRGKIDKTKLSTLAAKHYEQFFSNNNGEEK